MNNATEFDLVYGGLTVGHVKGAYLNDAIWYGVFALGLIEQMNQGLL